MQVELLQLEMDRKKGSRNNTHKKPKKEKKLHTHSVTKSDLEKEKGQHETTKMQCCRDYSG